MKIELITIIIDIQFIKMCEISYIIGNIAQIVIFQY